MTCKLVANVLQDVKLVPNSVTAFFFDVSWMVRDPVSLKVRARGIQLECRILRSEAGAPGQCIFKEWVFTSAHQQSNRNSTVCAFATFSGNKGIHAIVMFIEFRLWRFIRPPLNRNPGHCLHSLSSWMNHKNGHLGIGIGFHILKSLFASHVLCSQSHLRSLKCWQRYVTSALRAERMPNVDRAICRDRLSLKLPLELRFI